MGIRADGAAATVPEARTATTATTRTAALAVQELLQKKEYQWQQQSCKTLARDLSLNAFRLTQLQRREQEQHCYGDNTYTLEGPLTMQQRTPILLPRLLQLCGK